MGGVKWSSPQICLRLGHATQIYTHIGLMFASWSNHLKHAPWVMLIITAHSRDFADDIWHLRVTFVHLLYTACAQEAFCSDGTRHRCNPCIVTWGLMQLWGLDSMWVTCHKAINSTRLGDTFHGSPWSPTHIGDNSLEKIWIIFPLCNPTKYITDD